VPAVVLMEQLKPRQEDGSAAGNKEAGTGAMPERMGAYRIVREIGRGGMGVVYEAEEEALGRRVAVKVLTNRLLTNETLKARFRRESRAAARLHHTNIVPVLGVGETSEHCYYAMQLIEGQGLDQVIEAARATQDKARRARCRQAAQVGLQVAEALAYAHDQGVLHRDIKPSNLLLDVRGTVWVTDFGVAKLVEEAHLTQSGDFVGTLRYVAPEQFSGHSDARGDVYGLGVTLFELATLRPAFPDSTPQHLIRLITQEANLQPRKGNPDIPRDLETIILKAITRDPSRRYPSADKLADDLRRFLDDRPILARRAGPVEQAWRWCRRKPTLAAALASAFCLMVAITVISVFAYTKTEAANRKAAGALASEKAQREQAEQASTLALEALNRIYERFAPTRLVVTPQTDSQGVQLPPQPALPPEAIALLEDLLVPYQAIARSGEKFPKLQSQAADANYRIGEICKRLGRFEDAVAAYRAAIDLYQRQTLDAAGGPVRIKLARTCNELGWILRALYQFDQADPLFEEALRTLSEAPRELAQRPECKYERARASLMIGQRDPFIGPRGPGPDRPPPGEHGPPRNGREPPPDNRPGLDHGRPGGPGTHPAQRAAELLETLVAEYSTVPEYRHLLACCYRDIPPSRSGPGSSPTANMDRAVTLLRKLVADFPRVPDYQLDLCETLARTVTPERSHPGKPDAVKLERMEEAIRMSGELVAQYPNVPAYAAAQARFQNQLGVALFLAARPNEAEALLHRAHEVERKLVHQYPDVAAYSFWLSITERSLGRVLNERKAWPEARTYLEAAVKRMEAFRKKDRRFGAVRPLLGVACRDLAQTLEHLGESERAADALQKSRELGDDRAEDSFNPRPRGPMHQSKE
jgi:eukaryotic-like serine/threonine-protein kinase